jgi:hypothetical protein
MDRGFTVQQFLHFAAGMHFLETKTSITVPFVSGITVTGLHHPELWKGHTACQVQLCKTQ